MAQKQTVVLIDDTDEQPFEQGEGETISFSLDGITYEIDLRGDNAQRLRSDLERWVKHARRIGGRQTRAAAPAQRGKTDVDPTAVRVWAAANGIEVSKRGRISAKVVEQYRAAGN